ncbi:MAG: DUF192 domain-containing protein [Aquabacterium sp.]|uniref:DUF192 domain-containing protein n=1 Tax=Aquabacterium sp. TaxID=1872578 RepID=UPI0012060909|nr:DUF192 domain-containing protein [Aquabacterium sp.]TAK99904.1 MAG: DUF192 domain-containing protein [Aquabacterium sp.]
MSRIVFQVAGIPALKAAFGAIGLCVAATCVSTGAWAQDRAQHLPTVQLGAGMHNIKAEVAQTPQEQEIGLMFRTSMGGNDGMIFIFDRPGKQCFWMKNTLIPLAVAFVADDGTVVNVDEMKPQTLDPHCSTKPVRFVLEMNTGWFTKRAIKEGFKLTGAPFGTPR